MNASLLTFLCVYKYMKSSVFWMIPFEKDTLLHSVYSQGSWKCTCTLRPSITYQFACEPSLEFEAQSIKQLLKFSRSCSLPRWHSTILCNRDPSCDSRSSLIFIEDHNVNVVIEQGSPGFLELFHRFISPSYASVSWPLKFMEKVMDFVFPLCQQETDVEDYGGNTGGKQSLGIR